MLSTNMIKGRMMSRGLTQEDLARTLGIARATLCQKLNNVRPMSLVEAEKVARCLDIDVGDFVKYFFA